MIFIRSLRSEISRAALLIAGSLIPLCGAYAEGEGEFAPAAINATIEADLGGFLGTEAEQQCAATSRTGACNGGPSAADPCVANAGKNGTGAKTSIDRKITFRCGDMADKARAVDELLRLFGLTAADLCWDWGCSGDCKSDTLISANGDGVSLYVDTTPPECYYQVLAPANEGGTWRSEGCDC